MRAGSVISGMATGAVRLECGELPVDHFCIALVAGSASQVSAVILRLVRQARMAVVGRCPGIRAVAQAAVLRCVEVARIRPCCERTVVARRTGSKNLVVINIRYRCPHVAAVAVLANIRRLYM